MKLTKRDRELLIDFAEAAKYHGWQEDQGFGTEPARAAAAFEKAYAAMERRLARKPKVSK